MRPSYQTHQAANKRAVRQPGPTPRARPASTTPTASTILKALLLFLNSHSAHPPPLPAPPRAPAPEHGGDPPPPAFPAHKQPQAAAPPAPCPGGPHPGGPPAATTASPSHPGPTARTGKEGSSYRRARLSPAPTRGDETRGCSRPRASRARARPREPPLPPPPSGAGYAPPPEGAGASGEGGGGRISTHLCHEPRAGRRAKPSRPGRL